MSRGLYLSTVLYAAAKVFQGTCHWPATTTIILVGGIGMVYTALGGLRAIIWTDFAQFLILGGGLAAVLAKIIFMLPDGSYGGWAFAASQDHLWPDFKQPEFYSFSPFVRLTLWAIFFRAVGDHIYYKSADQMVLQQILATPNPRRAFRSVIMAAVLGPGTMLILYWIGLGIYQYYSQMPANVRPPADLALFRFISAELPAPMPGLILAAMLSALVSTYNAGITSLATVITKDFYFRFWRPQASELIQTRFSQKTTVFSGLGIILMSLVISKISGSVGGTVMESSGVWMSLLQVLGPVFLLGVTTRRATARHVLIAMAAGTAATIAMIVYYYWAKLQGHEFGFHAVAVTGFFVTMAMGYGLV